MKKGHVLRALFLWQGIENAVWRENIQVGDDQPVVNNTKSGMIFSNLTGNHIKKLNQLWYLEQRLDALSG